MNLETQISKIIEANGAALYDTEMVTEFEETIFRILITKAGGVSLDLCAAISHELSPFLDVHPPMSQAYRLEVSSPGIERKLSKPVHFKNAIGEKVKLKLMGGNQLSGVLKSADDEGIMLEMKEGEENVAYGGIKTARTYFDWN
ncbi:MAG TPA: ribosome maturation factor RimP [Sulfurovum sp.]|jgi:ribosome maturation factor RimP|nr:MAG: ribosome maturation factor RimP [Sulfurovum sp. 35-42-20]OYY57554.1 MAG: ribosome maturation factor RimP [Sulfurovum sp. 28-43-6]OYZ26775.1 MAG: ribosome maturation factor RimP [Sulfurovum sp. 16-42-52]OYZ50528.1 MAG: ribosome maturation factor RimP [Sulfurovum sp. 24-42-9]OZA46713.1 MAG: ribosome maturation factor RimP [Sulfurovum sp. 17-42-90]OZA61046.1 MAG: ribosome maturation factor RimP [Sulfurovum sp. 39-42-12]HQR74346.1 ribosome maturation factor RimP [Sulfurovum sp.]